jgi:hypothetical protein
MVGDIGHVPKIEQKKTIIAFDVSHNTKWCRNHEPDQKYDRREESVGRKSQKRFVDGSGHRPHHHEHHDPQPRRYHTGRPVSSQFHLRIEMGVTGEYVVGLALVAWHVNRSPSEPDNGMIYLSHLGGGLRSSTGA